MRTDGFTDLHVDLAEKWHCGDLRGATGPRACKAATVTPHGKICIAIISHSAHVLKDSWCCLQGRGTHAVSVTDSLQTRLVPTFIFALRAGGRRRRAPGAGAGMLVRTQH